MAKPTVLTISMLRNAADKLSRNNDYQWGHMGACNCGFLAQEITRLCKDAIHTSAMQGYGDWNEQLNDYCPTSGLPMDAMISEMLIAGFDIDDLKNLERLSDPRVLANITPFRHLQQNNKFDVITYMHAWADLLEQSLLAQITLPSFMIQGATVL